MCKYFHKKITNNWFFSTITGWYYIEKLNDGQKGWVPISATREIESNHIRARNFKQRHAFLKLLTSMDSFDCPAGTSTNDLLNNNNQNSSGQAVYQAVYQPHQQQTNRYSYYNDWSKRRLDPYNFYYSSTLWYFSPIFLYFDLFSLSLVLKHLLPQWK